MRRLRIFLHRFGRDEDPNLSRAADAVITDNGRAQPTRGEELFHAAPPGRNISASKRAVCRASMRETTASANAAEMIATTSPIIPATVADLRLSGDFASHNI